MEIKARFYKELFFSKATGYTVALYKSLTPALFPTGDTSRYIKVSGTNLPQKKGVTYELAGEWQKDRKSGKGKYIFAAESFSEILPTGSDGIVKYLQTLDGIGKKMAVRIYAEFGDDVFRILDEEPERLLEVKGLRKKTYEKVRTCWIKNSQGKALFAYLYGFRIPDSAIKEIYETYEEFAMDIVRSEPYSLVDFSGIGFRAADAIARDNGAGILSRPRIVAAMAESVRQAENAGSTCCCWQELYEGTVKLLRTGLTEEEFASYCRESDRLTEKAPLEVLFFKLAQRESARSTSAIAIEKTADDFFYFRKVTCQREKAVATNIRRLNALASSVHVTEEKLDSILDDAVRSATLTARLSPQQKRAVLTALNSNISIITGGPGTGKTFVQKAILYAWEHLNGHTSPLLLAPTGRAAKRMSESTGYPARTIHSALGLYETNDELRTKAHLECDLLIVDEASMLDNTIASILFSSIGRETKVVLVGDDKQLPSVGAGAVLRELLASEVLPTVALTSVFRQASGSSISYNAARMQKGETEMLEDDSFTFIEVSGTDNIVKEVSERYAALAAEYPLTEIVVLSPYRRSTASGVNELNKTLQKVIFPERESTGEFMEGDKVMYTRNENGLTNGDIGVVTSVSKDEDGRLLRVAFDDDEVILDEKDAEHLELAYATTIHKSQGSEYKEVLLIMDPAHSFMLTREIAYTAITRAKLHCFVIGQKKAFEKAVLDARTTDRKSLLRHFLCADSHEAASQFYPKKNTEDGPNSEEQIRFDMN